MKKIQPDLAIQVNESTGTVVAVYFHVRQGKAAQTKEFAGGRAFADYDRSGNLLGVEMLAPCKIAVLDQISRQEPESVRNFLRNSVPREMALAS
jgi:uncharacterized protein YuzE